MKYGGSTNLTKKQRHRQHEKNRAEQDIVAITRPVKWIWIQNVAAHRLRNTALTVSAASVYYDD
jgi:hypothetical protein